MTPRLAVTHSIGAVAGRAVAGAIAAAVRDTGRCRLGLAGGSSPRPVLEWLAAHLEPELVGALTVTWVDERHDPAGVPTDWRELPETSNLRGAWQAWFSQLERPPTLVPLDAAGTLDQALATVSRTYAAQVGGLDVVLLGCGPDGHVASLFPGHDALDALDPVLAIADSPKPPAERLTLSLPELQQARCTVLVASGIAKAPALRRAWQRDRSLPLSRTRPAGGSWIWVLDPDAASALGDDPR